MFLEFNKYALTRQDGGFYAKQQLTKKGEVATRKAWPAITKPKRSSNIGCKDQISLWKGPW